MDSLLSEAYDDSSYGSVDTLHHTDRENRAMASVFSYAAASFPYSSDPYDQLNQSPRSSHRFHSAYRIPGSNWTIELIYLLIAMIVNPLIRNTLHPFMEPRRMTPTGP